MNRREFLRLSAGAALAAGAVASAKEPGSRPQMVVGRQAGRLESLPFDGRPVSLPSGGGFTAFDQAGKKAIAFADGSVNQSSGKTTFTCENPDGLKLKAEFVSRGEFILVTGYLENSSGAERGIVLDYCIPCLVPNALYSNILNQVRPVSETEEEGNIYPIAAMCGPEAGLAMAIPPNEPRIFGMVGSTKGLTTRFYLGMSPETRNFPNRASFVFIIYPVAPAWGFRSALSKYYGFYPQYYRRRAKRDGLVERNALSEPPPLDLNQCSQGYVRLHDAQYEDKLAWNKRFGLITIDYTIVGMREIKFLKQLPPNYDEAMKAYARWTLKDEDGFPMEKEAEAAGRDAHLREEIDGSACMRPDGKYAITIRNTAWGRNSVTFYINPNPDLYQDGAGPGQSTGGNALKLLEQWLQNPQLDGVVVDSLGSNWPGILNYRKEHFKYARYPLTCDLRGRVALDNMISHYEFCESLRQKIQSMDRKYLSANGIYDYESTPKDPEEFPPKTKIGRFFLAALLDFATSEPGVTSRPGHCSFEFMRTSMGRKQFDPTNHRWDDVKKVDQWINKSLCYDLFSATGNRYDGTKYEYYYPEGYKRDKDLIDWFVPKARLLFRAGWEPVTGATATGKNLHFERYGKGDAIYLAIMSEAESEQACTLSLDLELLGFGHLKFPDDFLIDEIARAAPLDITNGPGQVGLKLMPFKTCIVALSKISVAT